MQIFLPNFEPFVTKVIFYRIPFNFGDSMSKHIGNSNVIKQNEKEIKESLQNKGPENTFRFENTTPEYLREFVLGSCVDDYLSFCVVRNPWDRFVSIYKSNRSDKKKQTFRSFCLDIEEKKHRDSLFFAKNQSDWCVNSPKHRVLRDESISDDFLKMCNDIHLLGVDPKFIPLKKKKYKHYSSYYDSETKNIIAEVFKDDIDAFKYTFTEEDSDSQESRVSKGFLRI